MKDKRIEKDREKQEIRKEIEDWKVKGKREKTASKHQQTAYTNIIQINIRRVKAKKENNDLPCQGSFTNQDRF